MGLEVVSKQINRNNIEFPASLSLTLFGNICLVLLNDTTDWYHKMADLVRSSDMPYKQSSNLKTLMSGKVFNLIGSYRIFYKNNVYNRKRNKECQS